MFFDRASDCSRVFKRAEDLDVGAGDERGARADQHDRIDAGVGVGARHLLFDAFEHARAHRVDGRIVDGENRDAISDFVMNEFGHRS